MMLCKLCLLTLRIACFVQISSPEPNASPQMPGINFKVKSFLIATMKYGILFCSVNPARRSGGRSMGFAAVLRANGSPGPGYHGRGVRPEVAHDRPERHEGAEGHAAAQARAAGGLAGRWQDQPGRRPGRRLRPPARQGQPEVRKRGVSQLTPTRHNIAPKYDIASQDLSADINAEPLHVSSLGDIEFITTIATHFRQDESGGAQRSDLKCLERLPHRLNGVAFFNFVLTAECGVPPLQRAHGHDGPARRRPPR
eukprot:scaffold104546_cov26-Prasinocladus_malaysianus.AAC.2